MEMLPPGCEVIRSKRKTVAIQIADDGHMIVRAPLRAANSSIAEFIRKNEKWIAAHTAEALRDKREIDNIGAFTAQDIRKMAEAALKVIPERVRSYAEKLGVTYGRITIRTWSGRPSRILRIFRLFPMRRRPEESSRTESIFWSI